LAALSFAVCCTKKQCKLSFDLRIMPCPTAVCSAGLHSDSVQIICRIGAVVIKSALRCKLTRSMLVRSKLPRPNNTSLTTISNVMSPSQAEFSLGFSAVEIWVATVMSVTLISLQLSFLRDFSTLCNRTHSAQTKHHIRVTYLMQLKQNKLAQKTLEHLCSCTLAS